jgi:hypothetical protein
MISAFRRYLETWYVRAFFLVMVAAFVLWGVGDMLRVVGTSTWVAKVGGTTIEAQSWRSSIAAPWPPPAAISPRARSPPPNCGGRSASKRCSA